MPTTPSDPAPHRALATVTWLNLLFKRGLVLVEHYLGPVSKDDVKLPPPPRRDGARVPDARRHGDRARGGRA